MPQLQLGSGLSLNFPDSVAATTLAARRTSAVPPSAPQRRRARAARENATRDMSPLLTELRNQGFELAGEFSLAPKRGRRNQAQSRRALPGIGDQRSTLTVDLAADEDAVVMTVDENDEIDWVFADGSTVSGKAPPRARSGRATRAKKPTPARAAGTAGRVTFSLGSATPTKPSTGRAGTRRGVFGAVLNGIAGWVFKFVRKKITGSLIHHLERNIKHGLVRITSDIPSEWSMLGQRALLPTTERAVATPPRVLLLVHGTFSSTVGSFGGLAFSEPGLAFLSAARSQYEQIFGWDHSTLSATPEDNAKEIRDFLDRMWPPGTTAPEIDVVAFSRGGLVFRTLLEQLLPGTRWTEQFRRVVFVASTLSGTKLAQKQNWKAFITILSNLAVAACRGVATLIPPAAVATVWVETVARGIAVLVRFLATAALDSDAVPGLAAMDPDQKVIKALNRTVPPDVLVDRYHAVTNDFEPNGPGAAEASDAMPSGLLLRMADLVMDAQMREANDLVVHESSMRSMGGSGLPDDRTLRLPQNGRTMHTTSFRDPAVIAQLSAWLIDGVTTIDTTDAQPGRRSGGKLRARHSQRATRRRTAIR